MNRLAPGRLREIAPVEPSSGLLQRKRTVDNHLARIGLECNGTDPTAYFRRSITSWYSRAVDDTIWRVVRCGRLGAIHHAIDGATDSNAVCIRCHRHRIGHTQQLQTVEAICFVRCNETLLQEGEKGIGYSRVRRRANDGERSVKQHTLWADCAEMRTVDTCVRVEEIPRWRLVDSEPIRIHLL